MLRPHPLAEKYPQRPLFPTRPVMPPQKFKFVVPDFGRHWKPDITPIPWGFGVAECRLSPDLAELFLACMPDNQRGQRQNLRDRYSADMKLDAWRKTHQGCAFNFKGEYFDGQHRALSVIETGKTIDILVFFGVGGDEEMAVTDTGGVRTTRDAARVLGIDVNKDAIATTRTYLNQNRTNWTKPVVFSNTEILAAMEKIAAELASVAGWFAGPKIRGIDRAPIRAAVLAALLAGVDPAKLGRFCGVMTDNLAAASPGESAAVLMRQWVTNNLKGGVGGMVITNDMFLRTCRAIEAFASDTELKKLYPASNNPFVSREPSLLRS